MERGLGKEVMGCGYSRESFREVGIRITKKKSISLVLLIPSFKISVF
jgi:hypothetical protein